MSKNTKKAQKTKKIETAKQIAIIKQAETSGKLKKLFRMAGSGVVRTIFWIALNLYIALAVTMFTSDSDDSSIHIFLNVFPSLDKIDARELQILFITYFFCGIYLCLEALWDIHREIKEKHWYTKICIVFLYLIIPPYIVFGFFAAMDVGAGIEVLATEIFAAFFTANIIIFIVSRIGLIQWEKS